MRIITQIATGFLGATACGVLLLLGAPWEFGIVAAIGVGIGMGFLIRRPSTAYLTPPTEMPLEARFWKAKLDQDLKELRRSNEIKLRELGQEAGRFPSVAECKGLPYKARLEFATVHIERLRDVITTLIADTIGSDEVERAQEAFEREILSLDLPHDYVQAEIELFNNFDQSMHQGYVAYSKELWDGSIKIARIQWGPDVIDSILAEKQAKLS